MKVLLIPDDENFDDLLAQRQRVIDLLSDAGFDVSQCGVQEP